MEYTCLSQQMANAGLAILKGNEGVRFCTPRIKKINWLFPRTDLVKAGLVLMWLITGESSVLNISLFLFCPSTWNQAFGLSHKNYQSRTLNFSNQPNPLKTNKTPSHSLHLECALQCQHSCSSHSQSKIRWAFFVVKEKVRLYLSPDNVQASCRSCNPRQTTALLSKIRGPRSPKSFISDKD